MIRLVQKKLIIPRGDTGVFSLPVPQNANTGDVAVFSIIDPRTHTKVYEKIADASTQTISIEFSHNDTVNLPVGKYVWDVKFYANPVFADGKLVNGDQVDSYYSAYKLPDCDITPTGDNLLTSDDSPSTTLTPEALNVLSSTLAETTTARDVAIQQATAAGESASIASNAAESASADAATATSAATTAVEAESQASASATSAINSAASAATDASAASADAASAAQSATSAANDAASASTSATNAAASATEAQGYAAQITGLSATAETLPAGAPATASYDAVSGVLTLGLPQGDAFHIVKTYASIAAMNADYSGTDVAIGEFVMIVSNVEDPDNAKVYVKGDHAYNFIVDMSGVTGLNGVGIVSIVKTATVENIDTYTITYTDGNTTTYNVVNGIDGDEYTVMVQNTQPTQESNKLWIPTQAGVVQEVPTVQEMNAAIAAIDVPVQDVQVNGTSVVTDGVANVPLASNIGVGVVKVELSNGLRMFSGGNLAIATATYDQAKQGSNQYRPLTPVLTQDIAFYGLAKAAGADMANVSGATVGVYPEAQKSAISTMLSAPVSVTGTTPTITALSGIQYVCGEVATLDITLPASGIVDVVFESGSTPTVLTITPPTGMTVEWANDFDSTALEADTLYELNVKMVGTKCLGVAGQWS